MANPIAKESETWLRAGALKGFYLVSETYNEAHFGDGLAVWSDGILYLRFVRDKGQWFLDFSLSRAEASFRRASAVFESLNAKRGMAFRPPSTDQLAPTVEQVKRHYNVIVDELEGTG